MNRKNRFEIDEEYKSFEKEEDTIEILEPTQEIPVIKEEIKKIEEPKAEERLIKRGCMVRFNGNKSYSGLPLSAYTGGVFKVKELSGNRAVIAKGSEVIAAVNIKDCVRV